MFFDLWGTLVAAGGSELLPGVREAVDRLPAVPLFVVANGSEVTRRGSGDGGDDLPQLLAAMNERVGGRITAARYCPHAVEAGCPGHTPAPGLVTDLAVAHRIDLGRAWYIGDTREDRECARRAGIGQFHWAQTFFAGFWILDFGFWIAGKVKGPNVAGRDFVGPIQNPKSKIQNAEIRPATEADLPAVVRIYNEAIAERISTCDLEPVTVAARRPWFERFDARHPLHVAVAGDQVIGWSAILPYDPKPGYAGVVEHSIYVARAARGAGLGRRLLEHLLQTATALGHRCTMGRIFRHNDPSLELHRRLGFEEVGVLPRVARLDGRAADVVIMLREL